MATHLKTLDKTLDRITRADEYTQLPMAGVSCTKTLDAGAWSKRLWRARFAIVAQGCKEIELGGEKFRAREGDFTCSLVDLPVVSRIQSAPFTAMLIEVEPRILMELDSQMEPLGANRASTRETILKGHATEKMIEITARIAKLHDTPEEARVVGPLLIRELFYQLLKTEQGEKLRQLIQAGSHQQKMTRAIHALTMDITKAIDVADLAKAANMSRSAVFKHFKEATSMSPIQYQKRLRLLEAKRRLTEGESAEQAAFGVGYSSASQFSREYSRMFGQSPRRDTFVSK